MSFMLHAKKKLQKLSSKIFRRIKRLSNVVLKKIDQVLNDLQTIQLYDKTTNKLFSCRS